MIKKFVVAAAAAPLLMLWAAVATAHHSAAPFDFSKKVTIEGVVKEFNVVNPHTFAVVSVTDEKGTRDVEYEGHSASNFYRAGFTKGAVKAGDKISILIAPRHDGADGGFIQAFTANGLTVGFGGLSPSTGKPDDKAPDAAAGSAAAPPK
jgi:hypothetical protein